MTNVSFDRIHDTYIFECCGHTGYSVAGRDILCSAVSVLCYTLRAYLEKLSDEGLLSDFISDFSEGNALMRFEYGDLADGARISEAVGAILSGFLLLEESFPDYITADI